jgi:hypothetical protein
MPKNDCNYSCSDSDSSSEDDSFISCKKCKRKNLCKKCEKKKEKPCKKCITKPVKQTACVKCDDEKELDICGEKKGNYIIITFK